MAEDGEALTTATLDKLLAVGREHPRVKVSHYTIDVAAFRARYADDADKTDTIEPEQSE